MLGAVGGAIVVMVIGAESSKSSRIFTFGSLQNAALSVLHHICSLCNLNVYRFVCFCL